MTWVSGAPCACNYQHTVHAFSACLPIKKETSWARDDKSRELLPENRKEMAYITLRIRLGVSKIVTAVFTCTLNMFLIWLMVDK